ncbi:MAG: GNAT family N-acetyltransferase [Blastocatellia bacterium]|nr:GNAT family N-acetyltransferase [Blastocatellia bacterium]
MPVTLRPIAATDLEACGHIIYEAFKGIADQHNFRPDFPSAEVAIQVAHLFVNNPLQFGIAAESDGMLVGSNFLLEADPIRSVGPITIAPGQQAHGVGRRLMKAVIERGTGAPGIRLVQDSFNMASLSLYASLGFEAKEPLVIIEGAITEDLPAGVEVRPLAAADVAECGRLCQKVMGFPRTNELAHRPPLGQAFCALQEGRIIAYASAVNFWPLNHGAAETPEAMQWLLAGASKACGMLSFVLPVRQAALFRWCLGHGMRAIKPMTLMAMGAYQEIQGCYLPSVGY